MNITLSGTTAPATAAATQPITAGAATPTPAPWWSILPDLFKSSEEVAKKAIGGGAVGAPATETPTPIPYIPIALGIGGLVVIGMVLKRKRR